MTRVVGIDATRGGWLAVVLKGGAYADALLAPDLAAVLARLPDGTAIVADVPIGLPPLGGSRRADVAARRFVEVRRSSVFAAPTRAALEAETYAEARALHPTLSAQAFALRRAILDAERHAVAVREGHPEVSFRALAGRPLAFAKRTWNGQMIRRSLLAAEGIELPDYLMDAGIAPADDVLNAAAMAWTARRVAAGRHETLPAAPARGEPVINY